MLSNLLPGFNPFGNVMKVDPPENRTIMVNTSYQEIFIVGK
jgi:hypothetical protein